MVEPVPAPGPDVLLGLLRRLLRPLVRLMIQRGVTYPVFSDMVSALFADVASRDLLTDDRARTDSRISMMTGIHRKELRRLRTLPPKEEQTPPAVTLGAHVVARWLASPPWIDDEGHPLALPRSAPAGQPSFDALVASVTKDVRPRTVFDEWRSQGIVTLDADDRIVLNEGAFVPQPGREEQLFYFARNLHDHVAAAVSNVSATGAAPFVDRSVHYDRLSPEAAGRLEAIARAAAQRVLVQVNREAIKLADADGMQTGPTRRVNLGVYLYSEDETPGATP